jgi:hypothetical protein
LPGAAGTWPRQVIRGEEPDLSDVLFLVLTVALFVALTLVVRGVEKL